MTTKRDYYEILGIQKGAEASDIKKAYRNLALKYHPDRVSSDKKKEAEERFKEISEAYAVLSDSQKKAQYDQFGHAGIDSRYSYEDIFRGADFGDIFENMGFGDIFEGIFGGGFSSRRRSGPVRGRDLEYEIEISFEEAVFGTEKEIKLPVTEKCEGCDGSGAENRDIVECGECNGAVYG